MTKVYSIFKEGKKKLQRITQNNICYDSIAIWNPRFTQGLGQGQDEPEFGKQRA